MWGQHVRNAVGKAPTPWGKDLPFRVQGNRTETSGCRPSVALCDPVCAGLRPQEPVAIDWRGVRAGQSLYKQGDALRFIFAVRSGSFKSTLTLMEGSARICAFPMTGDVLALDGIGKATYATTMTALDDAQVCIIARWPLVQATGQSLDMQGRLGRLMSDEMLRAQKVLVLMGGTSAQNRLGVFLMDLSQRHLARGYSGREFTLRMTRSDIGSFLGMALETVSRSFAVLQAQGAIEITNRRVQIPNLESFSKRYGAWL